MGIIGYLIVLAIAGLFIGALGRLAVPGPDPMTIWQTMGVGILGSFIAGLIARWIFHDYSAGIILSVICTAAIVYAIRRARGGTVRPYNSRR